MRFGFLSVSPGAVATAGPARTGWLQAMVTTNATATVRAAVAKRSELPSNGRAFRPTVIPPTLFFILRDARLGDFLEQPVDDVFGAQPFRLRLKIRRNAVS